MKRLILCGCGHGHIHILKNSRKFLKNIEIIVITDNKYQYYSGMYTGFLDGIYRHDEICFDVEKICHENNTKFILDKVVSIDSKNNVVISKNHKLEYDYLSVNLGASQNTISFDKSVINSKPINNIIDLKDRISIEDNSIVILGAGASGLELAFALKNIYPDKTISIITKGHIQMEGFNKSSNKKVKSLLHSKGIKLYENQKINDVNDIQIPYDKLIMCIGSKGVDVDFGNLPVTDKNFLLSDEFLRVSENIFAVGDCVSFRKYPNLPKAGVYAIRQSSILFKNIVRTLKSEDLIEYVPDSNPLQILYCSNEKALLNYKNLSLYSHFSFLIKKYIDRKYMTK